MIFTAALSFIITSTMFIFTYLPQAAVLALFNGPLAFVTAVPLVLGESSTIILLLAKAFWLTPVLDNLFDEVSAKVTVECVRIKWLITPSAYVLGPPRTRDDLPRGTRS